MIISDGSTSIHAKLTTRAIDRYREKHSRELTEKIEGCLVIVRVFEIVATNFGSAAEHISLLVRTFDYLGLEQAQRGSPAPIAQKENITK